MKYSKKEFYYKLHFCREMILWNLTFSSHMVKDISSPEADVLSNRDNGADLRRAQNMLLPR